ncbi:LysR substrate-binding domain-containing protein [Mycobacterium arosiense]|uniref:Probable hydrogen peroxide-inducible genes activator n=1 Tax=Mycobacterium arosiense ATCC BAA-1401 = DSM 45069 TaxID=1265311 RepID=A0A1W9ZH42_MYCAI|nr:LysR substrate-binding domain-containing protein [Mycobacterium arosiense]ORA15171.1 LysR family transcriptional regulator [Mycobacterium arosiense ATCC BAA-1401 = DSM 45069]
MELRHLRYFRAVAEELHFGRAARRLHIAQSPLSQQIRQLESELGVDLLIRTTRKVELTRAGQAYLKRAAGILDAVEEAKGQARRIANGEEGHLAIGCVGSATYSLLPRLVRVLSEELPGIEVSVRGDMLAPAQVTALLAGDIDLALLRPPVEQPGVQLEMIRRDRLIAALPEGHWLAAREVLTIADLGDEWFIAHAGRGRSVMNSVLTAVCADAGFVPRVRHEVAETSTLVTLVAAGLGVAIVPGPTKALGIAGVCYRPLLPDLLGVDLAAGWLAIANSPLLENTLSMLRRVARQDGSRN